MKSKLNADGHDESQWIKKEFNPKTGKMEMPPLINAFRAAKGDIFRNSDDKLESPEGLPRIMFINGRISEDDFNTAKRVESIWIHAQRTLGISSIKGVIASDVAPANSIDPNTDRFLEMWRHIPRNEFEQMLWFVSFRIKAMSAALPLDRLEIIQSGLQKAQKMIDIWDGNSNNALTGSPELRPEFDPTA